MIRAAQILSNSLASLAALFCSLSLAQVQIVPANPRYLEPVYVQTSGARRYLCYAAVAMNNNVISVNYQVQPPDIGVSACDIELGSFPTGTYRVQISSPFVTASIEFYVAPPSPSGAPPNEIPPINYSGMWWSFAEPGWGISIAQGPSRLFAVWFAYDLAGRPTWYTLEPGGWTQSDYVREYAGPIYRYSGDYFGGKFDPANVGSTVVGTGRLRFSTLNNIEFDYTVDDVTDIKGLTRLPID